METNTLLVAACAMVAVGGAVYALVYPHLSGQARAEKRQAALMPKAKERKGGSRGPDSAQRRKQINESLKDLEDKTKPRKPTVEARIAQAGLTWSKQTYIAVCAVAGLLLGGFVFFLSAQPLYAGPAALVGALGVPSWILSFLRKRRITKFIIEFPNAVDIIVRGIKAGLPVGDCLRIISQESSEPLRSEFRMIVEAATVGLSIGEAVDRLAERIPVPEASFFAIVVNIQQKAGGNLSEALNNLSRVLRDRKKMQLKVKAMSSEAKASAGIIGALPFIVTALVYVSSPRYIELLWTTNGGHLVLLGSFIWMSMGIAMMKKMINFDM